MEMEDIKLIDFLPNTHISRDGRIWRNGREKKFTVGPIGYEVVSFSTNNKTKTYYKHRLVLHAFVGECPFGCEALHINGNKLDNRLENLRWGTRKENVADSVVLSTIYVKVGKFLVIESTANAVKACTRCTPIATAATPVIVATKPRLSLNQVKALVAPLSPAIM